MTVSDIKTNTYPLSMSTNQMIYKVLFWPRVIFVIIHLKSICPAYNSCQV